jgi:hypothetical protein
MNVGSKVCRRCGIKQPADNKFCPKCGCNRFRRTVGDGFGHGVGWACIGVIVAGVAAPFVAFAGWGIYNAWDFLVNGSVRDLLAVLVVAVVCGVVKVYWRKS